MAADPAALQAALDEVQEETPTSEAVPDPYSCKVCGKGFATSQSLAGHVRKTGHKQAAKATTARESKPKSSAPRSGSLARRLEEQFTAIGMIVTAFGDVHCGTAIANGAPRMAEAWDKLAKENPKVRRILESMLTTSAWGEVAIATGAVVMPIMAHHDIGRLVRRPLKRKVPVQAVDDLPRDDDGEIDVSQLRPEF